MMFSFSLKNIFPSSTAKRHAFFQAVAEGQCVTVEDMLHRRRPDLIKSTYPKGLQIEPLRDFEARDLEGLPPIYTSVAFGQHAMTELLIKKGAIVRSTDTKKSPFLTACHAWKYWSHSIDARHTSPPDYPATLKALLNAGADINQRMSEKPESTALNSCLDGYFHIASFLIDQGADIELKDDKGQTLLHRASQKLVHKGMNFPVLLLQKGAKVAAVDNDGKRAVDLFLTLEDQAKGTVYMAEYTRTLRAFEHEWKTHVETEQLARHEKQQSWRAPPAVARSVKLVPKITLRQR